MIQMIAMGATREAENPARGHMEIEERPAPAPSIMSVNPSAAVANAPARTADHETPDEVESAVSRSLG